MTSGQKISTQASFPRKVEVARLLQGRYENLPSGTRPVKWDNRLAGKDKVELTDGSVIELNSSGQQSQPDQGWVLMLSDGDNNSGFSWTLYGLNS